MIERKNVTGKIAFDYIRKQISSGKFLSGILNQLPIEEGKVISFIPENTSEEAVYDFASGVYPFNKKDVQEAKLIPIKNDSKSILTNEIIKYINLSESNCCILEDAIKLPSDSLMKSDQIKFLNLNNNEVYYFLNKKNTIDEIEKTLIFSESYRFLCVLSILELQKQYSLQHNFLKEEDLNLFSKNIHSFFVLAYDGESYLMWKR